MDPRQDYFRSRLKRHFDGDVLERAVTRVIENQDRFYALLRSTNEPGIEQLITSIHKSSFFTAHSHSHHHYATGLVEHSLGVYDKMVSLPEGSNLDRRDIILTCLLHDLCMARNPEWPHERGRHGKNSRLIAELFLPNLSPEVKEAIQCHKHCPSPDSAARNRLWALIFKADRADAATSPGYTLKFLIE